MRKNKGAASEAKNEDGGDEDLVSFLKLRYLWVEGDFFNFSLHHLLRTTRQPKRRPPLPKRSKKKRKKKNRSIASKIITPSPHFSLSLFFLSYTHISISSYMNK